MKTRNNFLKKGIMSMLLGSCMAATIFANVGLVASAATETVYIDEDFEDYNVETIISSAANSSEKPEDVDKGQIIFSAGCASDRNVVASASVVEVDSNNKLKITGTYFASSERGISFTFVPTDEMPTVETLTSNGTILELSMDITNTNECGLTGFTTYDSKNKAYSAKTVPAGVDGTIRAVIDAANSKQYLFIMDGEGQLVSVDSTDLTASGFTGASFWSNGTSATIDNIKVVEKAADFASVTVSVIANDEPLADATVTIEGITLTTDENGQATVVLPNDTYTIEATKAGYEGTEGADDSGKSTVSVNSEAVTVEVELLAQAYTKEPTSAIVEGQGYVAAGNSTTAFTVSVVDQMGADMNAEEYAVEWAVYPTGTTTANTNVTIDAEGVVSIADAFNTTNDVEIYDVVVTATANNVSAKAVTTIAVGNSDVLYYEDLNLSVAAGDRGPTTKDLASTTTLSDVTQVVLNIEWLTAPDEHSTIGLVTDGGNLTGVQYSSAKEVTAWTCWTNRYYNQYGLLGAFTYGGLMASDVTEVEVTFTINKINKTVVAACGDNVVTLPYTMTANTLSGVLYGQTKNCGFEVKDILVKELTSVATDGYGELTGYSLSLSDQVALNYHMKLDDAVINADDAYLQFSLPDGEGGTTTTQINVSDVTPTSDGVYVFSCPVAAKQMTDTITAQLVIPGCSTSADTHSYSVQEYASDLLALDTTTDATATLVKAMLNYGAYAQTYFSYNTDSLANAGYEDTTLSVGSDLANYAPQVTMNSTDNSITYAGSTLRLENAVKLRHYFEVAEGTTVPSSLTAYTNEAGETYYYYESDGIKASALGTAISYSDAAGNSLVYSPLSYAYTVVANTSTDLTADTNLQNVLKAMYLYYTAVQAYNN